MPEQPFLPGMRVFVKAGAFVDAVGTIQAGPFDQLESPAARSATIPVYELELGYSFRPRIPARLLEAYES